MALVKYLVDNDEVRIALASFPSGFSPQLTYPLAQSHFSNMMLRRSNLTNVLIIVGCSGPDVALGSLRNLGASVTIHRIREPDTSNSRPRERVALGIADNDRYAKLESDMIATLHLQSDSSAMPKYPSTVLLSM